MRDAVAALVRDGDSVAIEGFTHLICFAAGHEIIRQRRRDLTLIRMTPDVIYDQMIGAGVARKLVFSWLGNPGRGQPACHPARHARGHRGDRWSWRSTATSAWSGATSPGPPTCPSTRCAATRARICPLANPRIRAHALALRRRDASTWCRPSIPTSPSSTPSAPTPRATPRSGASSAPRRRPPSPPSASSWWSRSWSTRRSSAPTPTARSSPGLIVDAVVVEPFGAHPSFAQGYYDRDNIFYVAWDAIGRDAERTAAWLDEWVHGLPGRADYMERLGPAVRERITPYRLRRPPAPSTTASTGERACLHTRRDDDRGGGTGAGRAARLFRRHRPAQRGREPGPAHGSPGAGAHLRGRGLRGPAGPAAALDRRPHHRHGLARGDVAGRPLRPVPAGRPGRRGLPGGGPDRPLRQHQQHRHRRLRHAQGAPARLRRRQRDRHALHGRSSWSCASRHARSWSDIDFRTSPGNTPGGRRGPSVVVTDLGVYHFDDDGEMRLDYAAPRRHAR